MASRTRQKEEARARRLAEERARAEQAQRTRRMRMLGGVIVVAIVIVGVVIAVSIGSSTSGGSKPVRASSPASKAAVAAVSGLLNGIPQSGETLGSPSAPVTITEYADLDCPVCDAFALPSNRNTSDGTPGTGYFDQLVNQYVRTGKVKVVYRSLETATSTANGSMWTQQQAAAYAAGLQGKAWDYIEIYYYEQQPENTSYVTPAYLKAIAEQVPGLNLSSWEANRQNPRLEAQVTSEGQAAIAKGFNSTPTFIIQGPKGQANPIVGLPSSFGQLASDIQSVS
jgi:protein-disulfide isomerase